LLQQVAHFAAHIPTNICIKSNPVRKVCYWDKEQKQLFTFLTNAMELFPLQVAELYKNRWQVELFF